MSSIDKRVTEIVLPEKYVYVTLIHIYDYFWSIGALATLVALVVIFYQASQTRKQMKRVEKEMEFNFRPRIYRENFSEDIPLQIEFIDKKQITVRLKFKNYGKLLKGKSSGTNIATVLFPNQIVVVPFTESDEILISDIIKKKELYISVLLEYEYEIDKVTSLPGVYQAIFIVKLMLTSENSVSSHSVDTFQERITLD